MGDIAAEAPHPPWALPPPPFQKESTRLRIILSYWLLLLLGVPFWWTTTSIERLALPRAKLDAISHLKDDLRLPVVLSIGSDAAEPFDVNSVGAGLYARLQSQDDVRAALNLSVITSQTSQGKIPEAYSIHILPTCKDTCKGSTPQYEVDERTLKVTPNGEISSSALLDDLARVLTQLLLPPSDNAFDLRVTQFAPRYRLALSLLNEDASIGGGAMGWEVEKAIKRYLAPTLHALRGVYNFTIESQVQFHSPLAFDPRPLESEPGAYALGDDELKVFVNSAEWTLASSTTNDPVLHFLLFNPAVNRRPLRILDAHGQATASSAWLVPQWGSVVLLNAPPSAETPTLAVSDLEAAFCHFGSQLQALLGVPRLPSGVTARKPGLTLWQIDLLMRHRTLENVGRSIDTMRSTVKLVDRIQGMPVGEAVRSDFEIGLSAMFEVQQYVRHINPMATFSAAARAFVHSSSAFFNPSMVAMLYFPTEHKYAVYTPLFAPVAVPLVVALVREIRARVAKRRTKAKTE